MTNTSSEMLRGALLGGLLRSKAMFPHGISSRILSWIPVCTLLLYVEIHNRASQLPTDQVSPGCERASSCVFSLTWAVTSLKCLS